MMEYRKIIWANEKFERDLLGSDQETGSGRFDSMDFSNFTAGSNKFPIGS